MAKIDTAESAAKISAIMAQQTHSLQAIVTTYLGPTTYRGGRIKARCEAGSLTVGWNHALDVQQNHRAAAAALLVKLGWADDYHGDLVTGAMPGRGYAHCLTARKPL